MSELALQLIAENKKTRSTFLDLGNCGLTEVPEEIGELVWLEGLSFSNTWFEIKGKNWIRANTLNIDPANNIRSLIPSKSIYTKVRNFFSGIPESNPFSNLKNLKELWLTGDYSGIWEDNNNYDGNAKLDDLTPLIPLINLQLLYISRTNVSNLYPLAGLKNLQFLGMSRTRVSDLTPLAKLTNLQTLDISSTNISNLVALCGLENLQNLFVSNTKISDLRPLLGLKHLNQLDLSSTLITELTPLANLGTLTWLDISSTEVNDIAALIPIIKKNILIRDSRITRSIKLADRPTRLFEDWKNGWNNSSVYVDTIKLTNPPTEIVKQGNAAILNFLHETVAQGTDHLYEAKMLLIGEGGAGKTSLLRRLYQTDQPLPDEKDTTKGIAIHRHEFRLDNERNFRLNVWDFGGQEIYHATHQFFLTKRSLYVLLDDTRKDDKTVQDAGFKYWLEVADLLGDHSPVLIFQNEKGGRSKTIDESGIKAKFNNVKDVYRGNLKQPGAADSLRKAVEFYAQNLPHIGEELPAKWVTIRADIEQLAEKEPFISRQDYFDIYQKHLDFDRDKALHLSRYLHDLGVFLHFQDEPLLARTVILQNTWATEAVFKMLDDETVKRKLGHFDSADCRRVWQDTVYADMHLELLALMQKFELCYRLPDTQADIWLAPQLLPPSKPEALLDWQQPGDLTLRYRYEFLPRGIVSRLMVRMHRFVKRPELSWISGALFERGGTELLAEVPAKGGEIVLRARGPERKELLSVISADLDALNDSFHGLKDLVAQWVPCICSRCHQLTEPEFFTKENLLWRKEKGRSKIECPKSFEEVDVLELLDGINVKQLPGWAKDEKTSKPLLQESADKTRIIKIFLASSSELKEDRDAFDLYFRQQNDRLRKQGIYLEIVRWEYFLDALSETRLQDEYNREVKACDIFVSLFFTKTGKYTEEEFDTAHKQFLDTGKPLTYTFFKNAPVNSGDIKDEINSLLNFKKKLADLGHFYTSYDDINHLKLKFSEQLDKQAGLKQEK